MIILYAIFHLKNVSRKLVPSDIKNYGTPALSYWIKSTNINYFFWISTFFEVTTATNLLSEIYRFGFGTITKSLLRKALQLLRIGSAY